MFASSINVSAWSRSTEINNITIYFIKGPWNKRFNLSSLGQRYLLNLLHDEKGVGKCVPIAFKNPRTIGQLTRAYTLQANVPFTWQNVTNVCA